MLFHNSTAQSPAGSVVLPARYWRLLALTASYATGYGGSAWSAYEIRMYESADRSGANLSIGATAFASSFYDGGYTPAKANDGSLTSYWFTQAVSSTLQWWGLDLGVGVAKVIRSLALYLGPEGLYFPRSAALQRSDNKTTWTTVKEFSLAGVTGVQNFDNLV